MEYSWVIMGVSGYNNSRAFFHFALSYPDILLFCPRVSIEISGMIGGRVKGDMRTMSFTIASEM